MDMGMNALCDRLGIEFPLFAFSHCRDVVAAVSRAGGFGVLGAVKYTPEELRQELQWVDDHCDGKPYGVDLIVPNRIMGKGEGLQPDHLLAALPEEHKRFAETVLQAHGVSPKGIEEYRKNAAAFAVNLDAEGAERMLEVAFSFPIRLIANALGMPPRAMIEMARAHDVPVAALVGSRKHAISQIQAGVDILVAAGGEAGGHCGEIGTMVLVPEVVAVAGDTPVLAAGGIVTGAQMAAAMAMGAAGAWCGSVWLTTMEAEPPQVLKDKMLAASSTDTVRSRSRTGKPSRQLRSVWTDEWEARGPDPLPMPLQSFIAEPALARVEALAEGGDPAAGDLATYWVGQGVGLMTRQMSAGAVVQQFKEDYLAAVERLVATLPEG